MPRHFGTNDVWSNRPTATILAAYGTLVEQMRAQDPDITVAVAQIIPHGPRRPRRVRPRVVDLDAAIPGWAASVGTERSPVVVVDQWTGFATAADTDDGAHPNTAGDRKMAAGWYPALADELTDVPSP